MVDFKRLSKPLLDGAVANGCVTELWTLARVSKLIEREFGVAYSVANVWRVLRALVFSNQRPTGRAIHSDETAIQQWRVNGVPATNKRTGAKAPREWRSS